MFYKKDNKMKLFKNILLIVSFLILSNQLTAQKNIYVLATGGTIAGAQVFANKPGYKSGSFSVDDLISAVPKLKTIANLKGEQVSNIGSQDMNDKVWLKLGKRVNELLAQDNVDGIVITHGTDTYEETAYYLNLVVNSEKPVVMVASMRPATAISADGPMNLFMGVVVASQDQAKSRGVLCVMNNEIHYAAEITKYMTVNVAAMKSPNRGLAGKIDAQIVRFFSPTLKKHTINSELRVGKDIEELPQVEIIYAHANMGGNMIDAAVASGAKGIIIAGVGDGNMTSIAFDALSKHAKNGIVIVRSSRVGMGAVKRNIEVNDDDHGFVVSMELNPSKARVLLQLALLKKANVKEIQQMYMEY